MEILILVLAVIIASAIIELAKAIGKYGFKTVIKSIAYVIFCPIKAIKAGKEKRRYNRLIKENKAVWTVGQEMDKINNLQRYQKDPRVLSDPRVKAFTIAREVAINKAQQKANKKKSKKSGTSKAFDKITK